MKTSDLLMTKGIACKSVSLNLDDFNQFKAIYKDDRDGIDDQKLLEYYVSYYFLNFHKEDVYVDIASQNCPFAFFIRDQFSCKVYRQDLFYLDPGINGENVGGDACKTPFENESITKISLHNSFEHFEGNNDIDFLFEAQRILRTNGKMVVVPFYIEEKYRVENDCGWIDANGEKHLWGIGARFSRCYDPEETIKRIFSNSKHFNIEPYIIENHSQLGKNIHGNLFLLFTKLG